MLVDVSLKHSIPLVNLAILWELFAMLLLRGSGMETCDIRGLLDAITSWANCSGKVAEGRKMSIHSDPSQFLVLVSLKLDTGDRKVRVS